MKKIILLILTLSVFFYGCVSDPERLTPPRDFKTGRANYLTIPLDTNKLANEGYPLDMGWNIFVWPEDQKYDNARVDEVLESVKGLYYYVYNYNEGTFFFPTDGKYSQLRTHKYYSTELFETLKVGNRYNIYMWKEGVLRYTPE